MDSGFGYLRSTEENVAGKTPFMGVRFQAIHADH